MICPECGSIHMYETTATVGETEQAVLICNDCGYTETDLGVIGASKLTPKQLAQIAKETLTSEP